MRYRTTPVEIEAIRWDGTWQGHADVNEWAAELVETGQAQRPPQMQDDMVFVGDDTDLFIDTPQGRVHAAPGDWIVYCDVQEAFYPVTPKTFAAHYEPVEVP